MKLSLTNDKPFNLFLDQDKVTITFWEKYEDNNITIEGTYPIDLDEVSRLYKILYKIIKIRENNNLDDKLIDELLPEISGFHSDEDGLYLFTGK